MPFFLAIGAGLFLAGHGVKAAAEGLDTTGTGAIKLAAAGGVAYLAYKNRGRILRAVR